MAGGRQEMLQRQTEQSQVRRDIQQQHAIVQQNMMQQAMEQQQRQQQLQPALRLQMNIPQAEDELIPSGSLTAAQEAELANIESKSMRKERKQEMIRENYTTRYKALQHVQLRDKEAKDQVNWLQRQTMNAEATQYSTIVQTHVNSVDQMIQMLNPLRNSDEMKDKIADALRSLRAMLLGIVQYSAQKVNFDDKQAVETHLNILQSMIGMVQKHTRTVAFEINGLYGLDFRGQEDFENRVQDIGRTFEGSRLRLSDVTREAMEKGETDLYWSTLIERARGEKVVDTIGKTIGHTGDAMSSVITVGTDTQTELFFKDDEKVLSIAEIEQATIDEVLGDVQDTAQHDAVKKLVKNGAMKKIVRLLRHIPTDNGEMLDVQRDDLMPFLEDGDILERYGCGELAPALASKTIKTFLRHELAYNIASSMGIATGQTLTERNLATTRMAELLGAEHLVARSERAKITVDQTEHQGFAMKKAVGRNYDQLITMGQRFKGVMTGAFQRQMIALQLLDNLCGQVDRHLNNAFYGSSDEEGTVVFRSVQGIDNDMSFGRNFHMEGAYGAVCGCLNQDGSFNLPFIDRAFYDHLQSLTHSVVKANFRGLLDEGYIRELIIRIDDMKEGIRMSIERGDCVILEENEWGERTLEKLLDRTVSGDENYNYVMRFRDAMPPQIWQP